MKRGRQRAALPTRARRRAAHHVSRVTEGARSRGGELILVVPVEPADGHGSRAVSLPISAPITAGAGASALMICKNNR